MTPAQRAALELQIAFDPTLAADLELGAAWREAKALALVQRPYNAPEYRWEATADRERYEYGPTPAAALRNLAKKLRDA